MIDFGPLASINAARKPGITHIYFDKDDTEGVLLLFND